MIPHGGMLASYLLALMRSGNWELALEVRDRYVYSYGYGYSDGYGYGLG